MEIEAPQTFCTVFAARRIGELPHRKCHGGRPALRGLGATRPKKGCFWEVMDIEIKAQMKVSDVEGILKTVWGLPDLAKSVKIPCHDHTQLHTDIAKICCFLADRNAVIRFSRAADRDSS